MAKRGKKKEESGKKSIKRLIKKNKRIVIALVAALFLLVSFSGYRAWLNFHFLTTDDLILNLEPGDKSLSIHYWEKPNVTINVGIDNSFVCDALCTYEFKDISEDSIIDKGTFTSKGIEKSFKKEFTLSAGRAGSGQKIYTFDVKCNNIKTFYCPTNENKRERSIFITLNYDISEYEKFLKETLRENITKIANDSDRIDIEVQQLNDRFFELGFKVNLNELEDDKEILSNDYDRLVLELKNIESAWSNENYILVSELFNRSYDSRIAEIKEKIDQINSGIRAIISKLNSLVDDINNADSDLRKVK